MPGKASSADSFFVIGDIKELSALNAILYHPNGQLWRDHWCSAREYACQKEKGEWTALKKKPPWKKCSAPFLEQCRVFVPHPMP